MKMRTTCFILIALLVYCVTINNFSVIFAQQEMARIQLTPNQANLNSNEVKIVKVSFSANNPISGFDLKFNTTGGIEITDFYDQLVSGNSSITIPSRKVIEETNVQKARVSYVFLGDNPFTTIDLFLKIRGNNLGDGKISIDQNSSEILTSNGNILKFQNAEGLYNIVNEKSSANFIDRETLPAEIVDSTSAIINLKISVLGISSYPKGPFKNITGTVTAVGRIGDSNYESQPTSINMTSNQAGVFSGKAIIPNFKDGNKFSLMIKLDKYLLKRICNPDPSENKAGNYRCVSPSLTIKQGNNLFDFSKIKLMPGDLGVPDGFLNGYDFSLVRSNFSLNTQEALKLADLNLDGVIDKNDYNLLGYSALNTTGENDQ